MTEVVQFDDVWRCMREAMATIETKKERWCEAEVNRLAGKLALLSESGTASVHLCGLDWHANSVSLG